MAFLQDASNQHLEQNVFLFQNQRLNLQNSTALTALTLICLQMGLMPGILSVPL